MHISKYVYHTHTHIIYPIIYPRPISSLPVSLSEGGRAGGAGGRGGRGRRRKAGGRGREAGGRGGWGRQAGGREGRVGQRVQKEILPEGGIDQMY